MEFNKNGKMDHESNHGHTKQTQSRASTLQEQLRQISSRNNEEIKPGVKVYLHVYQKSDKETVAQHGYSLKKADAGCSDLFQGSVAERFAKDVKPKRTNKVVPLI